MGIPKFFRYISDLSERYPLTSQLIQENNIPEFDNLYLDFNGIIHNCSHPDDENAHFRLSEEQIFLSIFAYVDHLFSKIKPKKLLFMAVDGVAPRAKMNQQRGRRFRTAKEAKEVREAALRKGEKLPAERPFDSNCITPGTVFMAKLSAQLRYFVNKKITEDSNWQGVEVVLSGHEVPGEGEHKIMEYIRLSRAQPDYNPNVRHCLYGLDADLIMLGLLSHDPHFCLLREEVKFGPSSRKKGRTSLESLNFYLLHLCVMREYLDLEFKDISTVLPFSYNLERIIDDFIILAVFVGNDFLPNLPDLHIHQNGLQMLFDVYKKVLPSLDGYLNESGTINTKRLQAVLDEMVQWEQEVFEREYSDLNWYKGKQRRHIQEPKREKKHSKVLTKPQLEIFKEVKAFVLAQRSAKSPSSSAALQMPNTFSARDRQFVVTLAQDLHLNLAWDEYDSNDTNLIVWRFPNSSTEPLPEEEIVLEEGGDEDEWEDQDEDDEESRAAVDRVLRTYEKAEVLDHDEASIEARHQRSIGEKMDEWKRTYYQGKLDISYDDPKAMADLTFRYVEGLQWVMHYYYSGVASWGWYYDYHYAPRISDLRGVDEMSFSFDIGTPFKPFEQLMAVLPEASRELVPEAYRELMYDVNSPILDFYPLEFEQDLNGKKQDWEAIVKIPFIVEDRLLRAMAAREHRLSAEEKKRNSYGTSTKFSHNPSTTTTYPSSLPGFLPDLVRCTCKMEDFDLPTLDGLHLVEGLCDGAVLGADALAGFPSLSTLPHTAQLGFHGVNVHGTESRNQSMVIHIKNPYEDRTTADVAKEMVGSRVFVGWPYLREGLVAAVSDCLFRYEKMTVIPGKPTKVIANPHAPAGLGIWKSKAEKIEHTYSKRCAVITGSVEVLLHVRPLKGLKRLESGAMVKDYEDPDHETEHALQVTLSDVTSEDPRFLERGAPPLSEEFPEGTKIFFLGEHAYGVAAQVSATTDTTLSVILAFLPSDRAENEKFKSIVATRAASRYYPSFKAAEMLRITGRALSRVTSSLMVLTTEGHKINLGLSLKFEAKALKVIDFSRKNGRHWEFSEKAVELIAEYKAKFPVLFSQLDRDGDAMLRGADIFHGPGSDSKVLEIKAWLKTKGVYDFEHVSLFSDQLTKTTVSEIEKFCDTMLAGRSSIKKVMVKGIPRSAVLKPSHAVYRLHNQHFALGDRVTMVQDSGGVPLSVKGVVVGLNAKSMDVVWDVPFMSGATLGDRCSPYRGATVEFNSCLNLTDRQFVARTNPNQPSPTRAPTAQLRPRIGPNPVLALPPGQIAASGFRPAPQQQPIISIMKNPDRSRDAPSQNAWVSPGQHMTDVKTSSVNQSNSAFVPPSRGRGPRPRGARGRGRAIASSTR